MNDALLQRSRQAPTAIVPLTRTSLRKWLEGRAARVRRWVEAAGFRAEPASHCLVPAGNGSLDLVLAGIESNDDPFCLGHLPMALPPGGYHISADWPTERLERAALGWALGAYQFDRYKKMQPVRAKLLVTPAASLRRVRQQVAGLYQVRDLVNTPAEDMNPEHLAAAVRDTARAFGARVREIAGDALLARNFPAIHAVGRAASHAPRLIDLRWGRSTHPKITLVGKGVCFDSGGLDLKTASGMRLMKKDMGGAAHALGLAHMIMRARLPVRLRLLIPAVENAVAGNAYRPGDVLASRKGLSIEIDNTDAEGRVILCDALTEAAAESPELIIDFATLTGAARVALGTDLPAMFCNRDEVAQCLADSASAVRDPVWRLPLHRPYRELIDSRIADIANSASGPYAGAITAALFLEDFVSADTPWIHFDLMAWNIRSRPGRPEGGEAMGLRAVFDYLHKRYGES
ncbi:MAG: leucyl aminopeptidase family protein [Gammaproteobacteria bacterium]|nr:leucyl aminopeptidase family protein [Gammaproteobacteria bacterium]NIM73476.1 leucyl aminopeptidase family protein [Gammaproteobacteria bacterium]NIN39885.1 leucyl aminopeptidase family protein [Gammaproteobacteria bacterium]NIO25285.1 leucyl aminopeptidase family protein [Gammaproteobacteria bacterium]NIO65912.1 leucyl aminopeptidase family protein [Gammaproteobacteria bacterium]